MDNLDRTKLLQINPLDPARAQLPLTNENQLNSPPRMSQRDKEPIDPADVRLNSASPVKSGARKSESARGLMRIDPTRTDIPIEFKSLLESTETDSIDALVEKVAKKENSANFVRYFKSIIFESAATKTIFIRALGKKYPELCAANFGIFAVDTENERLALAKICSMYGILHITNFELDADSHFQLACHAATSSEAAPIAVVGICKFNISNKKQLNQLAKLFINHASYNLSLQIELFQIEDEEDRYQIALHCMQMISAENGIDATQLNNFNLTDPSKRKNIVLACSKIINEKANWDDIYNYIINGRSIKDAASELIHCYLAFLAYNPARNTKALNTAENALSEQLKKYPTPIPQFIQNFLVAKTTDLFNSNHLESKTILLENLKKSLQVIELSFDQKIEFIHSKNKEQDGSFYHWIKTLLFYFEKNKISDAFLNTKVKPLIIELAKQTDSKYRAMLTDQIFSIPLNKLSKLTEEIPANKLIAIALTSTLECELLDKFILEISPKIIKDGKNQRRLLEPIISLRNTNIEKYKMEIIINSSFLNIVKNISSPSNDAKNKTSKTISEEKFNREIISLSKLKAIIEIDEKFANLIAEGNDSFDGIQRKIIINSLGVKHNLIEKYYSIFDNYRDSSTILTYFGRVKDHAALIPLKEFLSAVITGDYPKMRYEDDSFLKKCSPQIIEKWKNNITKSLKSNQNLQLHFYDDHQAWIRMGSDVRGSCQRVSGDASLNCGLIGATLDGKQKLCTVADKDGFILRRAILRLMWPISSESSIGEPYLLMEKIYPPKLLPTENQELIDFAIEQASRIGLTLVISGDIKPHPSTTLRSCDLTLDSGQLKYPVYSDAKTGLQNEHFQLRQTDGDEIFYLYQHVPPPVSPLLENVTG